MRYLFGYHVVPLLLILIIISCKTSKEQAKIDPATTVKEEQPPEQVKPSEVKQDGALEKLILGDWEWTKTICCGRTPFTETSETLKAPKILKFQQGGVLQYFSGDALTATQTYKVSYGLKDDNRPIITIGATRPGLLFIKDSTLIIDYGYVDLQQEYYVRRK